MSDFITERIEDLRKAVAVVRWICRPGVVTDDPSSTTIVAIAVSEDHETSVMGALALVLLCWQSRNIGSGDQQKDAERGRQHLVHRLHLSNNHCPMLRKRKFLSRYLWKSSRTGV